MATRKKISKLLLPAVAVFSAVVVAAAVARAVNWRKFREAEDSEIWDREKETTPHLIWQELKLLFDFNRFK